MPRVIGRPVACFFECLSCEKREVRELKDSSWTVMHTLSVCIFIASKASPHREECISHLRGSHLRERFQSGYYLNHLLSKSTMVCSSSPSTLPQRQICCGSCPVPNLKGNISCTQYKHKKVQNTLAPAFPPSQWILLTVFSQSGCVTQRTDLIRRRTSDETLVSWMLRFAWTQHRRTKRRRWS